VEGFQGPSTPVVTRWHAPVECTGTAISMGGTPKFAFLAQERQSATAASSNCWTLSAKDSSDEDKEGGGGEDFRPSLRRRFKAYFKRLLASKEKGENDETTKRTDEFPPSTTTTTAPEPVEEESYLEQAKNYVKAPFRYIKHYFADERQEEIDGLGDIIVSDETFDEEEANGSRLMASSSRSSGTAFSSPVVVESGRQDTHGSKEMLPSAGVATVTREQEPLVQGDRWAVSASGVDLSGNWTILSSDEGFKTSYDRYLELLGQPPIVRSVALSIVGLTTEETKQTDGGRSLWIRGKNVRGVWERTLTASGSDETHTPANFEPVRKPIVTIDKEKVVAEAWWENKGTVHRSWIRGVSKYGGGDFEAKRYLERDGKVLVCETTFHPTDGREKAEVTWRFLKNGETLDD